MNQLYIKRRQVPEVIFLSRCSFTGGINATMALERLSGVSKEIIFMFGPPFFFFASSEIRRLLQDWMLVQLQLQQLMSRKASLLVGCDAGVLL